MQTEKPQNLDLVAIMKTTNWTMKIRLFLEEAPFTVTNFVWLAQTWYYEDVTFHRVIKNFIIQWWDPDGTWMGWESFYGKAFKDEFNDNLSNIPWALSMANSWPSTNGSQFFIVHKNEATYLDGKHSVFGQVFEWLETIDKIASVKTWPNDRPAKDVKIISIEIKEFKDGMLVDSKFSAEENKEKLLSNRSVSSWDNIAVHYTWTLEDGEKFDSSYDRWETLNFTVWAEQMIKWFDEAVVWMNIWEKKSITLLPELAYGEYDPARIEKIPKEHVWPEFDKINVWDYVNSVFGPIKAIEKDGESITFDVNHKLAWKTLNFDIEIVDVLN